jgi:hypothetical protein
MTALYAYAVIAGEQADDTVRDSPDGLAAVRVGGVAAVVRGVDASEYEGERLERNVADEGWLERAVREHAEIVERLSSRRDLVPMRFGSIFTDEPSLVRMLAESQHKLAALLERVKGRVELGVRMQVKREDIIRRLTPALETPASGSDYLRMRQAQLRLGEQADAAAAQLSRAVHAELAAISAEAVTLPLTAARAPQVLNAAYLVARDDVPLFLDCARRLARDRRECSLEVTGPWAPYSFCSVDVAGASG